MKKYLLGIAFLAGALSFMSCNDIDILSPPGPEGKNAYEVWVDAVNDGIIEWGDATDLPNYFKYLKGEPGDSAYVTWKEYIRDNNVDNPHKPGSFWDENDNSLQDFYNFLTGAEGDDGLTPFINDDGFWQIGDQISEYNARGDTVRIGANGNWFINDVDTTVPAAGQSAYQIWVKEVTDNHIVDPSGNEWPTTRTTLQDFWNFLKGTNYDGTDPMVVERTPLTFESSVRVGTDNELEACTFKTDPGATVTMNYEGTTVSGTADSNGYCTINFPNNPDREFYAVAYAEVKGKLVSYPVSVRVRIRSGSYDLTVDYTKMEWFDRNDQPTTEIGHYELLDENGVEITHLWMDTRGTAIGLGYVVIPFTTENVVEVIAYQMSGLDLFNIRIEPVDTDDYSSGNIVVTPIDFYSFERGYSDFVITAITNQYMIMNTLRLRMSITR